MVVEVVLYAAPLRSGTAVVASDLTLRALRGAGAVLARRPQPLRVAILAPSEVVDPAVLAELPALLRRAATVAALPDPNPRRDGGGALPLQSRRALYIFGALLLLAAGESWAQVVAGLWLVVVFPLFLRAQGSARLRAPETLAGALALAASAPSVVVHRHAGLAMLGNTLTQRGSDEGEALSYVHLARECRQSGVPELASLYDALASGERATGTFTAVAHAAPATTTTALAAGDLGDTNQHSDVSGQSYTADPDDPGAPSQYKEASHGLLQQPA